MFEKFHLREQHGNLKDTNTLAIYIAGEMETPTKLRIVGYDTNIYIETLIEYLKPEDIQKVIEVIQSLMRERIELGECNVCC